MRGRRVGSLLGAAILLSTIGASGAYAAGPPAGPADDPGTQAMTTQATVDRAKVISKDACDKAAASATAAQADPNNVAKQTQAAADAATCASAQASADKEQASLDGVNGGIATEPSNPTLPADVHNPANGAVKSDNIEWLSNSRGLSNQVANPGNITGNYAGANFIHYEKLGYDFMVGDGQGGLSIWSLKNPEQPLFVGAVTSKQLELPADEHGPADAPNGRFYEGENPTVDARRKLAFLARDPRSFGVAGATPPASDNRHPHGRTGIYIVDVKNPWDPKVLTYHWVPAGHTQTCINDCRYLWTVGPANNGSQVNGEPQDLSGALDASGVVPAGSRHPEWTGVPAWVTDVRDPLHPYTYAQPVDMKRNNNTTAYTHSVDVDQNGIAWTSGFGGIRGWYTSGLHHDPLLNVDRYASAYDPVAYAGGSVDTGETGNAYATNTLEHNSFHRTQAASDTSSKTVTTASGRTLNKTDLQYITQENVVSCTSTSGGGPGRFVIANLAGSYNGEAWDPKWKAYTDANGPENRFYLETLGTYTAKDQPGSINNNSGCSAHWFTVQGDMVAIAFYGQGVRVLDVSDPTNIKQAAYIRIPGVTGTGAQPANNASAAYWHNGYIYVADYSRGIDVLRFTDPIKGVVQPKVCWNSCDASQTPAKTTDTPGSVGATVPATLSLTMGTPAGFGAFTPGVAKDYTAQTTATVISTAGDALLSVADPSGTATGHLVNGAFSLPSALQAKASSAGGAGGSFTDVGGSSAPTPLLTYAGPISNDAATLAFQQHISAGDALRTGTYNKTLTFTLSTTTP